MRPQMQAEPEHIALIEASGVFEAAWYLARAGQGADAAAPVLDYLLRGEALNLWPGPRFDPAFYNRTYPPLTGEPASALIRHCLARDASQRPSTKAELEHQISQMQRLRPWTDPLDGPEISYCIPVMNRLADLQGTLAFNLREHRAMVGQVEFIVGSFDRDTTVPDWLERSFPDDIASGLLRSIRLEPLAFWHFGRAKNGFAPHLRGRLMSSLDADNFVTAAQSRVLLDLSAQTAGFAIVHHFSGHFGDGTSGRVTLPAAVYRVVGYDERLFPRQFDEYAVMLRAMCRFPFLPVYRMEGCCDVFEQSMALRVFQQAERLVNARRTVAMPEGPAPINPRGETYVANDEQLKWTDLFNAAQTRFELARGQSFRREMLDKARWAGRELRRHVSPASLGAVLFEKPPQPGDGLTLVALCSSPPSFVKRFCAHHLALGVSRLILLVAHDDPPDHHAGLPSQVETIRCDIGLRETAGLMWLETAFRCALHEGQWGMMMETSELLQLPSGYPNFNSVIEALGAAGRDRHYALAAHVIQDNPANGPTVFRRTDPCSATYRKLPRVQRDFGARASLSWALDAEYQRTGEAGAARRLVLMRNLPGFQLEDRRSCVFFDDPHRRETPWDGQTPDLALHDHALRLKMGSRTKGTTKAAV